jgi:NADH dehydrogenase
MASAADSIAGNLAWIDKNNMTHIVIVGGGFAGATLVRALAPYVDAQGRDRLEITLLSEESYTTYNPMLAEVVGAALFPEHVVAPLREIAGNARFVMGRVTGIDFEGRTVHCDTLHSERHFSYDHLVLAFGNRARLDLIAGMAEHGHVLKTVGDAMHLRNLVLRRLAQMELDASPFGRAALGSFVVIGGGFSGVETAGALADVLAAIHPYYPLASRAQLKVSLLHDGAQLLPQLPPSLGLAAAASLRERGVDVRLGATATAIDAGSVHLQDGTVLPCATAIATIGTRPNQLLQALALLPQQRGRIVCDGHCAVAGVPAVWAIGDCAQIPLPDGSFAIPTAQFAVAQAKYLASALLGKAAGPFSYRSRGMMATVGHRKGVADIAGIRLAGFPAWLLWRAYYLSQMPTLSRRLRVFVEWTWGMFFRPDITHFRFERSCEQERAGDGGIRSPLPPLKEH